MLRCLPAVAFRGTALVGADGIHVTARTFLFGPEAPSFSGTVAGGLRASGALQWAGSGRPFLHFNVRRGEMVNWVCEVEKRGWEHEFWTERGDHAELKHDFAGWHEGVQRFIDAMDPEACFKWVLFARPPMPQEAWAG